MLGYEGSGLGEGILREWCVWGAAVGPAATSKLIQSNPEKAIIRMLTLFNGVSWGVRVRVCLCFA